ncbi:MAG TPA: hypothetical protein VKT28_01825 [Puia sp.]|nr:hypothetical protein [Puia sp.]
MKTILQSSATKATKGISNAVAFVVALSLALGLGCLVVFVS